ncbi:MAG: hypothetical protein VYC34_06035, partial [Planctomycetota bacterium]|nr:hypothetical protein [Planctomycetota bacterium]
MSLNPEITHRLELPHEPAAEIEFARLPTLRGVALFENEEGRATYLAVTGNARALARRRLAPGDEESNRGRVDHRAVTRRVLFAPAPGMLEADAVFLALARERLPGLHQAALTRWQGWFIHVNPETQFPRFMKTPVPAGAESAQSPPKTGMLLGPLRDKHASARYIEAIEDLFDLCRYHHLLIQAPNASACAYKDMGRCPAPCDGSESMESYRGRLAEAAAFAAGSPGPYAARLESEMRSASEGLDFERAERCRVLLERAEATRKPEHRFVRSLDDFRFLFVSRSESAAHARLIVASRGSLTALADVRADADRACFDAVIEAAHATAAAAPPCSFSQESLETIGLVSTHVFAPKSGQRAGDGVLHL